ncbi:MAG: hypothetical protein GKR87_12085 [Kiritimatiellae bacterium]|nr:hypothetical protein [Kiritimatiellia bacterium]
MFKSSKESIRAEVDKDPYRNKRGHADVGAYAWLAIITTLCFAALVVLQITEIVHYKTAPSVWPAHQ